MFHYFTVATKKQLVHVESKYLNIFSVLYEYNGANPISINYCIHKLPPYNWMGVIFIAIQMHTNPIVWHKWLSLYLHSYCTYIESYVWLRLHTLQSTYITIIRVSFNGGWGGAFTPLALAHPLGNFVFDSDSIQVSIHFKYK